MRIGSEDVERITPLGFTNKEALAWFKYNVLIPSIKKGVLMIGLGSALVFSMLTPLAEYLESSLTLHMIAQHFIFILAGFLFGYGGDVLLLAGTRLSKSVSRTYMSLLRMNARINKRGMVTFVIAMLLAVYWHIPATFDAAVSSESIHIQMHATFLMIGSLIFIGAKLLPTRMRHLSLVVAGKGMGLFGAFLLFTTKYIYHVYPAWEQSEAGLAMVVMMIMMDLTIVPYWLYNYFGRSSL